MMLMLEQKIAREVQRFDFISLIHLLYTMGYSPEQILLVSHHQNCSQSALIQDIEFRHTPVPRVTISLNMGLLSAQSPLPSYFMKKIDEGFIDSDRFIKFLQFFDHLLLRRYALSIYPEANHEIYPSWEKAKRQYTLMLNLRACSTLHWLFDLVFPELTVQVEKAMLRRTLTTQNIVLGRSRLDGSAFFGRKAAVPVHGRRVSLTTQEEQTSQGIPWPREVKQRMEAMIFPLLKAVGIDLEVILVIKSRRNWAKLQSESYLGYEMIKGAGAQPLRVPIFLGHLVE